ncbi:MAG: outer membrane beta-barrel protein [Planctomycetes bacterium]|nr:outer membrane beta-barrel protein [Planctomycetota bacterium]
MPSVRPSRLPGLLIAACATSQLGAAELVVRDIGLGLQMQPSDFSYTVESPSVTTSGSDGFDSGYGIVVRGLYSFTGAGDRHGFLAGLGLGYAQYAYDQSGELVTYGIDGGGGYGFAVTDQLHLSAMARLGLGVAHLELPDSGAFPAFSADGASLSYGVEFGIGYQITERLVIGADLGYRQDNYVLAGTHDIDVTLDNTGFVGTLSVCWRLAVTPWRLE